MELSGILKYGGYGLGGLFLLLVIVWIVTAVRIVQRTKGLPQALNNFFAAIVNGKLDAAYNMTTKAYRRQVNRKDFVKFIKKNNPNHPVPANAVHRRRWTLLAWLPLTRTFARTVDPCWEIVNRTFLRTSFCNVPNPSVTIYT